MRNRAYSNNKHLTEILKCFDVLGRTKGPEIVFRDWCRLFSLAIENSVNMGERWKQRENEYMNLIKQYTKEEAANFPKMCAALMNAIQDEPWADHLGSVYMNTFSGNKGLGQVFTPFCVSEICSEFTFDDKFQNGQFQSLLEPCCGGGSMIIAFLKICHERNYNYQRYLKIDAGDLDSLCVNMCYIQLSLLGARAIVRHKDALLQKEFDYFVTPMEYLWPMTYGKVAEDSADESAAPAALLPELPGVEAAAPMPQKAPETAQAAKIPDAPVPSPSKLEKAPEKRGQLSLF